MIAWVMFTNFWLHICYLIIKQCFALFMSQTLSVSPTEVSCVVALHCLYGILAMFGNEFASFMFVRT